MYRKVIIVLINKIKPRLREVIGIALSKGSRILILNFDDVQLSLFLLISKLKFNFSKTIANQKANQCSPGAGGREGIDCKGIDCNTQEILGVREIWLLGTPLCQNSSNYILYVN